MVKKSAGLLMYKIKDGGLRFFLVHPGGPFWKNKNKNAWSIPKGEMEESEEPINTAIREFEEETGIRPKEPFIPLGEVTQKSGKVVYCWAFQGDFSGILICKSQVKMEYPKNSGKIIKFPEVDRANFFAIEKAKELINPAQYEFLIRLKKHLGK